MSAVLGTVTEPAARGFDDASAARGAARDLGREILHRIRDRWETTRDDGIPHPLAPGVRLPWHPLSTEAGDLGLALVFASADRLDPDAGWDERAHGHVVAVVEAYRHTAALGVGLFGGTAGVAHLLRSVSRDGTRYRGALASVDAVLVSRTREHLAGLDPRRGLATSDYDLINGLAGVAWYGLQHYDDGLPGDVEAMLVAVVGELDRRAAASPAHGLATEPDLITDVQREHHPALHGGYVDLGLAHGVAGVLAALGEARRLGLPVGEEGIDTLRGLLAASLVDHGHGLVTTYHHVPRSTAHEAARTAWCYGNPGLAVAAAASEAPGREGASLPDARTLLGTVRDTPVGLRHVGNPSACHGVAGLVLVDDVVPGVLDRDVLLAQARSYADPTTTYGLHVEHVPGHLVDSPGLLEGAGGTAVALLQAGAPTTVTTPTHQLLVGRTHHDRR